MVNELRIGPLKLATNLLLAPMAGFCDMPYRLVVRSCGGVGLASTALLSPQGILRANEQSLRLAATSAADSPLAYQIYGSDPEWLCEAARWSADRGADAIDLNMGCPVPKVTRKDGGSRLLCDPDKAVRLAEAVVRAAPGTPVTAKLRLGWDDRAIVAPALARRLEEVGIAAIIIHGRTAEMMFSGRARLDGIAAVVAAVRSIPVIGNGDVKTPPDAAEMIRATGCAGVMIGRAALAAPWIFRDTWSYLTTGVIPPQPSIEEKVRLMREHFMNLSADRGERVASVEFRKHIAHYAKHLPHGKQIRIRGQRLASRADFERLMEEVVAMKPT